MKVQFLICILMAHLGWAAPNRLEIQQAADQVLAGYEQTKHQNLIFESSVSQSPLGFHVTYVASYQGLPIWGQLRRAVHFDNTMKVFDIQAENIPQAFRRLNLTEKTALQKATKALNKSLALSLTWTAKTTSRGYYSRGKVAQESFCFQLAAEDKNTPLLYSVTIDGVSGQLLEWSPIHYTFARPAEGLGQVFRHNPVAGSGLLDGHSAEAQARALVTVPLRGLDGSGHLRGEFVDTTNPERLLADYPRPFFEYAPGDGFAEDLHYTYGPSDPAFEEVMAYYWIDSAQRFLQRQGFQIFDRPINVNVHAFKGHNAFFDTYTKALFFGDGRVQSAEDASVISHEYGHAILNEIVGERFTDILGVSFHEGFADYFAYAIASAQSEEVGKDLFPEYLAEWLALNTDADPPHLRSLLGNGRRYPNLSNYPHENGQLWSSAFYELDQLLPPGAFLNLLLEALYLAPSADPKDVLESLFRVEEQTYHGLYQHQMTEVFRARGLDEPESANVVYDLNPGETEIQPDASGITYFRFEADDTTDNATLAITSDWTILSSVLADGYLPNDYFYIKYDVYTDSLWYLNKTTSNPRLVPGHTYYVAVRTTHAFRIQLTLNQGDPNPPITLAAHQPWNLELDGTSLFKAKLPLDGPVSRIKLDVAFPPAYLYAEVYLRSDYAVEPSDLEDQETISFIILDKEHSFEIDLPESFQNTQNLFLSISGYPDDSGQGSITVTWEPRLATAWSSLPLNETTTTSLDDEGFAYYQFDTDEQQNIVLQTDATHPFLVDLPYDITIPSSLVNGIHTAIFQKDSYGFESYYTLVTGDVVEGTYRCRILGLPGESVALTAQTNQLELPNHVMPQVTNSYRLEPNELKLYLLQVPADAIAFSLAADTSKLLEGVSYQLFEADGKVTSFFDASGHVMAPRLPGFRQTIEDKPWFQRLEPGKDYQLWFHNPTEAPIDLDFVYNVETSPREPKPLNDGTIVEQDWSVGSLAGTKFFHQPYLITPPTNATSVLLDFDHLMGKRETGFYVKSGLGGWNTYGLGHLRLSEIELGFVPNRPFLVYFGILNGTLFNGPAQIRVNLSYETEKVVDDVFEETGTRTAALSGFGNYLAQIKLNQPNRSLEIAWTASNGLPRERLSLTMDRDQYPNDGSPIVRSLLLGESLVLSGESAFQPVPGSYWSLNTSPASSDRWTNYFDYASPLDARLHVKYKPLSTDTVVASVPGKPAATLLTRRLLVINPDGEPLTLNLNGEDQVLPGGGFLSLDLSASEAVALKAAHPTVLFEYLAGPNWTTLTAPNPFQENSLLLPHLPPSSSPWFTELALAHSGAVPATLSASTLNDLTVNPGPNEFSLRGELDQATWLKLEAGKESPDSSFGEDRLSGTQYWTLDGLFAAERAGLRPSTSLFVPHVPNLEDWWLGISLTNPQGWAVKVTVSAYDAEGQLIPQTHQLTIPANSSKTALLSEFFPYETPKPTWLKFQTESFPIMGLGFIGNKKQSGVDVACYGLPHAGSPRQILPGAIGADWYGLAVINPLDSSDPVRIEAIDANGTVLAALDRTIDGRQKLLIVGNEAFSNVSSPYYIKVTSTTGRILSLQLNGPALGMQSGIAVP